MLCYVEEYRYLERTVAEYLSYTSNVLIVAWIRTIRVVYTAPDLAIFYSCKRFQFAVTDTLLRLFNSGILAIFCEIHMLFFLSGLLLL